MESNRNIYIYIFKTFRSLNPHLVFLSSSGGENKVQPLIYRGREQPRNLGDSAAHFWFLVQFSSVNTLLLTPNEFKKVTVLFSEGAFLFMFIPMVCLMHSIPLPGQPFPVAALNCQQHLFSYGGAEPCWPSPPLMPTNTAHQSSCLYPSSPCAFVYTLFDTAILVSLSCGSWSSKLFYLPWEEFSSDMSESPCLAQHWMEWILVREINNPSLVCIVFSLVTKAWAI